MATPAISVPMINPAGAWGAGSFSTGGIYNTASGFNSPTGTGTGGPGTYNFGNAANPSAIYGGTPITTPRAMTSTSTAAGTTTPAAGSTGVQAPGTTIAGASNTMGLSNADASALMNSLNSYYGQGMGGLLYQYIMGGGGMNMAATAQATDATTNAMQGQINLGANDLATRLGAAGISPSSSVYGGEMSNFMSNATAQENQVAAQNYYNMWNAAQQREASILGDVSQVAATAQANKPNWMDYLGMGLDVAGTAAGVMTGIGALKMGSAASKSVPTAGMDIFSGLFNN